MKDSDSSLGSDAMDKARIAPTGSSTFGNAEHPAFLRWLVFPRAQEPEYPWDKVRAECWSQVKTVFRERDSDGALQCFYRAAPVDNARKLDDEQIQALRDKLSEVEGRLALPAWQPLETAPTNERVLVLLKPEPFQVVGEITFGYFTLSTDIPGGVWTYDETGDACCPQFWMPLPPPPSAEGE